MSESIRSWNSTTSTVVHRAVCCGFLPLVLYVRRTRIASSTNAMPRKASSSSSSIRKSNVTFDCQQKRQPTVTTRKPKRSPIDTHTQTYSAHNNPWPWPLTFWPLPNECHAQLEPFSLWTHSRQTHTHTHTHTKSITDDTDYPNHASATTSTTGVCNKQTSY